MESILNQSLKQIEILVIDDGSIDNTCEIVKRYTHKYNNCFLVRDTLNKGVGQARNEGLVRARGEYIAFLDADDWVDSDTYLLLVDSIYKYESDIAICGIKTEYDNLASSKMRYNYRHDNNLTGRYALRLLAHVSSSDIYISPMVGNKVYRKSFLDEYNIRFPNISFGEDDVFAFVTLLHANKISIVPDVYFHYYQRMNSLMHSFSYKHIDDFIQAMKLIREYLNAYNLYGEYKEEYYAFFEKCFASMLDVLFQAEQNNLTQKRYLHYFFEKFKDVFSVHDYIDYIDLNRIRQALRPYK